MEEVKINIEDHMNEPINLQNVNPKHLINNPFEIDYESATPDY